MQGNCTRLVFGYWQRVGIEMAGIFVLFIFMMMKMNDKRFMRVVGSKMIFKMCRLIAGMMQMGDNRVADKNR